MEKEKSRMKRVLASALLVSLCSMQAVSARYVYDATTPFAGTTSGATGPDRGGVIFMDTRGAELSLSGQTFSNNVLQEGTWADGGAIALRNGTITLKDVRFVDNYADLGGALGQSAITSAYQNDSEYIISNAGFDNNSAKAGGAAGFFNKVQVSDSTFSNNKTTVADDGGGAIFLGSEANAIFSNVDFISNSSHTNGGAIAMRDFIQGNNSNAKLDIIGGSFSGNTAEGNGGAIYNTFFSSNENQDYVTITAGTVFDGNQAASGGAIYNDALDNSTEISSAIIEGAIFTNNIADESGSAIFTKGGMKVSDTQFQNNHANGSDYAGGAIKVNAKGSTVEITDSEFSGNTAENGYAGAIYHSLGDVIVKDTDFIGNSANGSGAVMQGTQAGHLTIEDSLFEGNTSHCAGGAVGIFHGTTISNTQFINNRNEADASDGLEGGGAIFMGSISTVSAINNVVFKNNYSATDGGAIGMRDPNSGNNSAGSLSIEGAIFENNIAVGNGGAVQNTFKNTVITDSEFTGNQAVNGGAIYNQEKGSNSPAADIIVEDVSFTNNSASGQGGAIFSHGNVTVNAVQKDVVFEGNIDSSGTNDIIMNVDPNSATVAPTLSLNAVGDSSLTLNGGVNSADNESTFDVIVNAREASGDVSAADGQVIFGNAIKNAKVDVYQGTLTLAEVAHVDGSTVNVQSGAILDTVNEQIENIGSNITLQSGAELKVDIDAATGKGDNFSGANVIADSNGEKNVVINEINAVGETNETNLSSLNIASALGLTNVADVSVSEAAMAQTYTVMTPIRKMNGIIDENGMMTFAPTGNGYKDFNPAVMAAPVAAQLGGYLTQLNAYNQAFHNMDMYMLMTKSQRKALKMAGRVASTSLVGGVEAAHKDNNMWFNPYASYEKVDLNHGPKVENTGYGMFFGGESDLKDLGHGWDGVFGAYVGYNGSHQSYDGVSVYQNGGSLGLVGMAYKDNFFTGLTINTGANAASANTRFGDEDFAMLMAGIASKSGYNFEFKDGKVILQPSLLMSYTMVNTFDYDNGANVNITSDALHAFQLEPGVKVIGNLKNGWQPYAGVSFVWNLFDKAKFQANDVSLPQISVKPYVKYGVGVRKSWGERLTGFFQTYVTNGGRNGVGFQAGFSFAIGKDSGSKVNATGKLPEIKKLELSLKNSNHS